MNDPDEKVPEWVNTLTHPDVQKRTLKIPGMFCGWCGNMADAFPKRLDVIHTEVYNHGGVKITYLCRQCGHTSQWMEQPKRVNF